MARRQAEGTINQRRDGAVWKKEASGEWKQLKDGTGGSNPGNIVLPVAPAQPLVVEEVDRPWRKAQERYNLDGHLPPEELHPQHVHLDAEGNIDSKPVMFWKDQYGVERRTYTIPFHWNRYAVAHTAQKASWEKLHKAHQELHDEALGGSHAAMAALVALQTGRAPEDVCQLHAERVATALEKGDTSDRNHPDRVHLTFTHARGHAYTTSLSSKALAEHARKKPADGPVFATTPEEVQTALVSKGVDATSQEVRHHIATHLAVDFLSKTPPVKLDQHGLDAVRMNLMDASDKIAAHFGHDPTPEGMSYVPPAVQLAYLEEAGGEKYFPVNYARLKGLPDDQIKKAESLEKARSIVSKTYGSWVGNEDKVTTVFESLEKKRLRKSKCSPTEARSSSNPPISTSSTQRATPSSTKATSAPTSSTLGQSARSSAHEGLEKAGGYLARLPPGPGEQKFRYVYDSAVLTALLDSGYFDRVAQPGARFFVSMNGMPGYVDIQSVRGRLVAMSHSGTGRAGTDNIDSLRQMLLKFHASAPDESQPPPEKVQLPESQHEDRWANEPKEESVVKASYPSVAPSPRSIPEVLAEILSEVYNLRDCTQLFHFNVVGSLFPSLHPLFGEQYEALSEEIDAIAERIRGTGTRIKFVPKDRPTDLSNYTAEQMASYLAREHRWVASLCDSGVRAAEEVSDSATVDLLGKKAADHRKAAWMLSSTAGVDAEPEVEVRKSSDSILSDIGSRPPIQQQIEEIARLAYTSAIRKNELGLIDDETLREITKALYYRDYLKLIKLSKGDGEGGGHERSSPSNTGKPGPKGMAVGTVTKRQSGTYRKESDGHWSRVAEGHQKHAKEQGGRTTVSDLRDLLTRLRAKLHSAPKSQKAELKDKIERVKQKIRTLAGRGESTHKSDMTLQSISGDTKKVLDPIDKFLKGLEHDFSVLANFARGYQSYEDFAVDLGYADSEVRSQVHLFRIQKGSSALREFWSMSRSR